MPSNWLGIRFLTQSPKPCKSFTRLFYLPEKVGFMTFISKAAITLLISVMSVFVLHKPPAPTTEDLQPRYTTVFVANEAPIVPTTQAPTTTVKTALNACEAVFQMARYVGWDEAQLGMVVAVAQRESRCDRSAHNTTLNRDKSTDIGVMQINDKTWCLPSRHYPKGYMQAYGLIATCQDLFDLETNLRAALNIYRYNNGWQAWGGK